MVSPRYKSKAFYLLPDLCETNYLDVLKDNDLSFFMRFICLIAVKFRIHINATYCLYFLTKIRMCVRSIFYLIDSANKGLVQEIVILVFHRCLYNKQKILWPLRDTTHRHTGWTKEIDQGD